MVDHGFIVPHPLSMIDHGFGENELRNAALTFKPSCTSSLGGCAEFRKVQKGALSKGWCCNLLPKTKRSQASPPLPCGLWVGRLPFYIFCVEGFPSTKTTLKSCLL